MTIREQQEQWEHEYLVQGASFSDESRGKVREEALCDIRTIYQRDRDRILHSKTFRRLKQKTQVFLAPEGDHPRESAGDEASHRGNPDDEVDDGQYPSDTRRGK